MDNNPVDKLSINLLDKTYHINCPPQERQALTQSARYLDEKMSKIHASGKIVGLERIAIMAALNISHELVKQQQADKNQHLVSESRLQQVVKSLEDALAPS
jgi:cell division protein ZapA